MAENPISFEEGVELLLSNNFSVAENLFKKVFSNESFHSNFVFKPISTARTAHLKSAVSLLAEYQCKSKARATLCAGKISFHPYWLLSCHVIQKSV